MIYLFFLQKKDERLGAIATRGFLLETSASHAFVGGDPFAERKLEPLALVVVFCCWSRRPNISQWRSSTPKWCAEASEDTLLKTKEIDGCRQTLLVVKRHAIIGDRRSSDGIVSGRARWFTGGQRRWLTTPLGSCTHALKEKEMLLLVVTTTDEG